jgi:membrane protease YdiL (CAAX protease family)
VNDIAKAIAVIILFLIPVSFVIGLIVLAFGGSLDNWAFIGLLGIALYGFMLLAVWRLSVVKYRCRWDALGFRSLDVSRASILAAVVIGAALVINVLYGALITYLGLGPLDPEPVPVEYTEGGLNLAALCFIALIAAPVAEETFFRGFVFAGVRKRLGYGWGAGLSSLLFASAHFELQALVPIFFLGLLLAWLYVRTRSIWACIFTHSLYNSIALLFVIT